MGCVVSRYLMFGSLALAPLLAEISCQRLHTSTRVQAWLHMRPASHPHPHTHRRVMLQCSQSTTQLEHQRTQRLQVPAFQLVRRLLRIHEHGIVVRNASPQHIRPSVPALRRPCLSSASRGDGASVDAVVANAGRVTRLADLQLQRGVGGVGARLELPCGGVLWQRGRKPVAAAVRCCNR